MNEIKCLFKGIRIYLGLNQKELARLLGISAQSYISQIESGVRFPSKNLLDKLMKVIENYQLDKNKLIEYGKMKKNEWSKLIKSLSKKFSCSYKHSRARLASILDFSILKVNWLLGNSKYKILPVKFLSKLIGLHENIVNNKVDLRKLLFLSNKRRVLRNFPNDVLVRHVVKCLRYELRLPPEQIATKVGMNKDFYKRWELGYVGSTFDERILDIFDKDLQNKVLNSIKSKKILENLGILELWQWHSTDPNLFEGIIGFRVDAPYFDGFDFHWRVFQIIKNNFDTAIFGPVFASKGFKFEKGVDVAFRYKGKLIGVEIKDYHKLAHHRLGVVLSWKIGELKRLKNLFSVIILIVNNKLTSYVKRKFQENGIVLIDNTGDLIQSLRRALETKTYKHKKSFPLTIRSSKNRHKLGRRFEDKVYKIFKKKGYERVLRRVRIKTPYFPRGKEIDLYIPKGGIAISCKSGRFDEKALRNELLNLEMLSKEIPEVKKVILAIDHKVSSHMKSISDVTILEIT